MRESVSGWRVVLSFSFAVVCAGCDDGELRGSVQPSTDGETYLVVLDDNGGKCGGINVDGRPWVWSIGEAGKISQGRHVIDCGGSGGIEVTIPAGTVYSFDYWGP
jgi:hypothetical protein